jgi:hypothetical protein
MRNFLGRREVICIMILGVQNGEEIGFVGFLQILYTSITYVPYPVSEISHLGMKHPTRKPNLIPRWHIRQKTTSE